MWLPLLLGTRAQCRWIVCHNSHSHFNLHISHLPFHAFCCVLHHSTLSFAVIWCLCGLALTPSCPLRKSIRASFLLDCSLWKNLEWHIVPHPIVCFMNVLYMTEQGRARTGIMRALLFHYTSNRCPLSRCIVMQICSCNSRSPHTQNFGFNTCIALDMLLRVYAKLIGICWIVHFVLAIMNCIQLKMVVKLIILISRILK